MAKKFKLGSKEISFNWDTEKYVEIRKDYLKFREEQLKEFYDSIDGFPYDKKFPDVVENNTYYAVQEFFKKFSRHYINAGIYNFNVGMLSNHKDYQRIISKGIQNMVSEVKKSIDEVDDFQSMEEERRAFRKAGRTRVHGYGVGVSGLIGSTITSGVINGATGILHGLFNAIGNASTAAKASKMRRDAYAKFDNRIRNAVKQIFKMVFGIVTEQLNITVLVNSNNASIILKNIKDGTIPDEAQEDALLHAIANDPFSTEIFICYIEYLGLNEQTEKQITAIAEHFMLPDVLEIVRLKHMLAGFTFNKIENRDLVAVLIDSMIQNKCDGNKDLHESYSVLSTVLQEDLTNSIRELDSKSLDQMGKVLIPDIYDIFVKALEKACNEIHLEEECINFLKMRVDFFEKFPEIISKTKELKIVLKCEALARIRLNLNKKELEDCIASIFIMNHLGKIDEYQAEPWKILLCAWNNEEEEGIIVTFNEIKHITKKKEEVISLSEIKYSEELYEGFVIRMKNGSDYTIPVDDALYREKRGVFTNICTALKLVCKNEILKSHFEEDIAITDVAQAVAHYESRLKESFYNLQTELEKDLFGCTFDSLSTEKDVMRSCWEISDKFWKKGLILEDKQIFNALKEPSKFFADKDFELSESFIDVLGQVIKQSDDVGARAYFGKKKEEIESFVKSKFPQRKISDFVDNVVDETEEDNNVYPHTLYLRKTIWDIEVLLRENDNCFFNCFFSTTYSTIDEGLFKNAMSEYGGEHEINISDVCVLYNNAIFNSGSKGFMITDTGILTSRKEFTDFYNISHIKFDDSDIIVTDNKGVDKKIFTVDLSKKGLKELFTLIDENLKTIKSSMDYAMELYKKDPTEAKKWVEESEKNATMIFVDMNKMERKRLVKDIKTLFSNPRCRGLFGKKAESELIALVQRDINLAKKQYEEVKSLIVREKIITDFTNKN